jgi:hypothetical protein
VPETLGLQTARQSPVCWKLVQNVDARVGSLGQLPMHDVVQSPPG